MWVSSSHCANGACVEVDVSDRIHFSAASDCSGGSCVEVGQGGQTVYIRDGKLGDKSPIISIPAADWPGFLDLVTAVGAGDG
jgi:hypothetical protein